jgi:hypothetical protein
MLAEKAGSWQPKASKKMKISPHEQRTEVTTSLENATFLNFVAPMRHVSLCACAKRGDGNRGIFGLAGTL